MFIAYLVIGYFIPINCFHLRFGRRNFLLREKFESGWVGTVDTRWRIDFRSKWRRQRWTPRSCIFQKQKINKKKFQSSAKFLNHSATHLEKGVRHQRLLKEPAVEVEVAENFPKVAVAAEVEEALLFQ